MVAHPEQPDHTIRNQLSEPLHSLGQGDKRIRDVRVHQVQPPDTKTRHAPFRRLPDRLGRQTVHLDQRAIGANEVRRRRQRPRADLGRDDDLVADAAAAPPAAEQFLALPALGAVDPEGVVARGVDERPAGLDEPVQDGERGGLVGPAAHQHRAQAEHAHLAPGRRVISDGSVSHTDESRK